MLMTHHSSSTLDDSQVKSGFVYCVAAPTQVLEPVTLPGIVSCVLSVLCGGMNLLRGVHAIESVLQVRV